MLFTKFLNTIKDYSHEVDDLQTVNALVNSAFKDWIASKGIGQVVVLENGKIISVAGEERFTQVKNQGGFPEHAINWIYSYNSELYFYQYLMYKKPSYQRLM